MEINRIVSFLPSATELLYEIGAQDKLYGVTHECLYPEDAKSKPRIINSVFDPESMSSKEIDQITTKLLKERRDIFALNEENLLKAEPDLIISQNTCEVCAAHNNQVNKAISILEKKPLLHSMDPHNIDEILQSVVELGKIIKKENEANQIVKSLKDRINFVKSQTFETKPKVLALEWIEPFFTAGHWVPEMIQNSGGENLVSKVGEKSRRMEFKEIVESEPEIIIIMSCGFDTNRIIKEYRKFLKDLDIWNSLDAVKNNNVFAVDANSYFSKPSIRTITGIEILSKIIHPHLFHNLSVPENAFKKIS